MHFMELDRSIHHTVGELTERISTVCYPPVNMMDGLHRVAFASQPHGELVVLPPEYISPM